MTERDPNPEHYTAQPVAYPQPPAPAAYVQTYPQPYTQPNYAQPVSPSQPQQVMPAPGVTAKNPALAAFLQFLFVGAGSVYVGQLGIGILWFCAAAAAWFLCLVVIGFILVSLVYIGATIQAYVAASNFNRRNGIQVRQMSERSLSPHHFPPQAPSRAPLMGCCFF
jgi:TM2 domain-containing membrane protein YozV